MLGVTAEFNETVPAKEIEHAPAAQTQRPRGTSNIAAVLAECRLKRSMLPLKHDHWEAREGDVVRWSRYTVTTIENIG